MTNKFKKYKLSDKIHYIKNIDKDGGWMEGWTKNRSLANFPNSSRLLFCGTSGCGKTLTMKNCFLATQASDKPFKKLYIICPDAEAEENEWDDAEPDEIFDYVPELEMFDTKDKKLLIIDDFEFKKMSPENEKRLTTLFRYTSTHKNLTIFCSYQSFFSTPILIRKLCNIYIIYKPKAKNELKTISNRVGVDYDFLKNCFRKYATKLHDSITIDLTNDTPAKIRKNLFEVIDYHSDSEDSEDE